MRSICAKFRRGLAGFVRNETGAQVVEYALIVALVSIAIVAALRGVVTDTSFTGFIAQIKSCLIGTTCGAAAPAKGLNLQPQRVSPV
jgi:pilus assembly protein Flp/PilA